MVLEVPLVIRAGGVDFGSKYCLSFHLSMLVLVDLDITEIPNKVL